MARCVLVPVLSFLIVGHRASSALPIYAAGIQLNYISKDYCSAPFLGIPGAFNLDSLVPAHNPAQLLRKVMGRMRSDLAAPWREEGRNNYGPSPWPYADLERLIPSNVWVMEFNSLILVVEGG